MEKNYRVGSIVEGKVVRITNLGAFVELEPGIVGFVRTAQCALRPIAKVEDALEVGQKVCTKVTKIFGERIKLSIREALIEEITAEANTPIWSDERRAIKWLFH